MYYLEKLHPVAFSLLLLFLLLLLVVVVPRAIWMYFSRLDVLPLVGPRTVSGEAATDLSLSLFPRLSFVIESFEILTLLTRFPLREREIGFAGLSVLLLETPPPR